MKDNSIDIPLMVMKPAVFCLAPLPACHYEYDP